MRRAAASKGLATVGVAKPAATTAKSWSCIHQHHVDDLVAKESSEPKIPCSTEAEQERSRL
jgi:hypothetical protein